MERCEVSDPALHKLFLCTLSAVEHRAAVVIRGSGLSDMISDTDPHSVNSHPVNAKALSPEADFTASLINKFLERSHKNRQSKSGSNRISRLQA